MVGAFEKILRALTASLTRSPPPPGTAAIHTALGAINLNPGDEVITAPITDLGTIIPILNQGAIPVFADINDTYNMDPLDVEKRSRPGPKRSLWCIYLEIRATWTPWSPLPENITLS